MAERVLPNFVEAVPCRFPWHKGWREKCPRCRGTGWEVVSNPQTVRLEHREV